MGLELWDLLLASLVAAGVGFLSGVFGVGGGFLLVPTLNILLGVPMPWAVGSTACQVLGPATTSLLARRITREDLRLPLVIFGGLLVGVLLGSMLLTRLSTGPEASARRVDMVVLGTYAVMLTGVGLFVVWESFRAARERPIRRGWIKGVWLPPMMPIPGSDTERVSIPLCVVLATIVGGLSGLLGISGGLLMLPGLVYVVGVGAQRAVVASLVVVWIVSAQSTIAHAWQGNVQPHIVIALLVGGTIGARLGSDVGSRLTDRNLRQQFGWLTLATALLISLRWLFVMFGPL